MIIIPGNNSTSITKLVKYIQYGDSNLYNTGADITQGEDWGYNLMGSSQAGVMKVKFHGMICLKDLVYLIYLLIMNSWYHILG